MSDVCRCGHERGVHRNDEYCQQIGCRCEKYDPTGVFPLSDLDKLRAAVRWLRSEVNCRIEHGAESGGHLEYVQRKLDEILKKTERREVKQEERWVE